MDFSGRGRHLTKTKVVVWKGDHTAMAEFWGTSIKDVTGWLQSPSARRLWEALKHEPGDRKIVIKLGE